MSLSRMKLLIKVVFISLFIMTISQGCIKENLAECVFNINLVFEQNQDCQIIPQYPADINRIDVFAFDRAGLFVKQFSVLNPNLGPHFSMPVSLPQGNYTLITWAGINNEQLKTNNFIVGHTSINDLYIPSFFSIGNEEKARDENLYYGIKNVTLTTSPVNVQQINLIQDTKPFIVKANGLDVNKDYRIEVSNNTGYFNFNNRLVPLGKLNNVTTEPLQKEAIPGSYKATSMLLWPMDMKGPQLSIYDISRNAAIFSVSIADLLSKLPAVDFNCETNITVEINYLSNAEVEVSINNWKVIYFNGEI